MSRLTKEQAEKVDMGASDRWDKHWGTSVHYANDAARILDLKDELAARWQPIETAPKDGTKIRAYGTRHGSWGYSEDELVSVDAAWHWKDRRWIDVRDQAFIPRRFTPTHWMPLPEPPQ